MSLTPWCCWPPEAPVVPPTVPTGLIASGVLDTDYPPGASQTLGISQIVGIGSGHVRLTLSTPVALEHFNAQATCLADTKEFNAEVQWLNSTTVDVWTFQGGDPISALVMVLIFDLPMVAKTPLPNPAQILGANLAVWLQGDLGTGAGPAVATWVNQVTGNGNAIQAPYPSAPVLAANAFGLNPGVNFVAADAGLEIHLTTPFAIGDRPYTIARAKLNSLVHTAGAAQLMFFAIPDPLAGDSSLEFDAEATGTFDPSDTFWNCNAGGLGGVETFITNSPPPDADTQLLGPHTIQVACQQAGALVIDSVSLDAPSPVSALTHAINRIRINSDAIPSANTFGFWNIGVLVMTYTQPTAPQIAALKAWCDAYG